MVARAELLIASRDRGSASSTEASRRIGARPLHSRALAAGFRLAACFRWRAACRPELRPMRTRRAESAPGTYTAGNLQERDSPSPASTTTGARHASVATQAGKATDRNLRLGHCAPHRPAIGTYHEPLFRLVLSH